MIYLDYKMNYNGSKKKWFITELETDYKIDNKHQVIVEAFINDKPIYFKTIEGTWMEYSSFPENYSERLELSIEDAAKEIEAFTKYDNNKANIAIIADTSKAIEQVANVMQYGANKYSRKNWDKVDDKERYISAAYRHLMLGYQQGEAMDKESGLPHLAHAICSLLFLLELDERGK